MDWDFEEDEPDDEIDNALDDCGYDPDYKGVCWHLGTEHCSFFCPFHSVYFPAANVIEEEDSEG